ncbi:MAG: hypothetical protein NTX56_07820 [Proteobacteria bacterium]|nr:hypothetical protein [Pseudomonadota bacterium]
MESNEKNNINVVSGFEFSLNNGQVTGMGRVLGSHVFNLRLPSNATFSVDSTNNTIAETVLGTRATELIQFTQDPANASLYHLSSDTVTVSNPTTINANGSTNGYAFVVTGSTVVGMQSVWGNASQTHTQNMHLIPTSSFAMNGNTITETLVQGNSVEVLQFIQSGSAGLYAVASDSVRFIPQGVSTTPLSVNPFDQAKFTFDAVGAITQAQHLRPDGSLATIVQSAQVSFSKLADGYVIETVTNGKHSSFDLYHDGNGDGVYTAIAHGSGTSVDLVGVQSQVSPIIDSHT